VAHSAPTKTVVQDPTVVPGPLRGLCPPVSEIMVLEARKVFDFCFQEDLLERCFFVPQLTNGAAVIDCQIVDVVCTEVNDREHLPDGKGLALVSLQITLTINVTIVPATGAQPIVLTRTIAFPKRVVLCAPLGTDVTCDVRGTCICTVQPPVVTNGQVIPTTEPNVCCTIQLCIVVILDTRLTSP